MTDGLWIETVLALNGKNWKDIGKNHREPRILTRHLHDPGWKTQDSGNNILPVLTS